MFAGIELLPVKGRYIVTKDNLNVRARPRTNGKKITKLNRGEKVQVIGKAKGGEWYAIQKEGKDLGFVYAPVLVRMIDGRLEKEITGEVKGSSSVECKYSIKFESETDIENEVMSVADYWVSFECQKKGKRIDFSALMFLTEMPYIASKKNVYQIGLEIAEVGADYDKALSATIMYHLKKKSVLFDSVSPPNFKTTSPVKAISVEGVPSALKAAIKIAFSGWNEKFWQEMVKN
ncbi:MAG: SH3 domain-containing protein [Rhodospirillales bacterium]|nr:SH3 domain-containing protein [Rhodospirillales bacterium]